jgi:hypothetical protein
MRIDGQIDTIQQLVTEGQKNDERYYQLKIFLYFQKQPMNLEEWNEARGLYADLGSITRTVDQALSGLVFLSYANNVYYLCVFFFHGYT